MRSAGTGALRCTREERQSLSHSDAGRDGGLKSAMKTFENFSLTKCYAQENMAIRLENNQPQ